LRKKTPGEKNTAWHQGGKKGKNRQTEKNAAQRTPKQAKKKNSSGEKHPAAARANIIFPAACPCKDQGENQINLGFVVGKRGSQKKKSTKCFQTKSVLPARSMGLVAPEARGKRAEWENQGGNTSSCETGGGPSKGRGGFFFFSVKKKKKATKKNPRGENLGPATEPNKNPRQSRKGKTSPPPKKKKEDKKKGETYRGKKLKKKKGGNKKNPEKVFGFWFLLPDNI